MKPLELYAQCAKQINLLGDNASIILVIPRNSRGDSIRLAGKQGPSGIILSEYEGRTNAAFSCRKVIAWLEKILLPHRCFICEREDVADIPWICDVDDHPAKALFTCKNCPPLPEHMKQQYGATIHSVKWAIGNGHEVYFEDKKK